MQFASGNPSERKARLTQIQAYFVGMSVDESVVCRWREEWRRMEKEQRSSLRMTDFTDK